MKGTWSENPFQREWKASSSKTRIIEKEIQKQMLRGALVADPFQTTAKKKKKRCIIVSDSSTKSQLVSIRGGVRMLGSSKGLSGTHFKGTLPKRASKSENLCALSPDEHKPILSLFLPSSNLFRINLHPCISHQKPFRKFAKYCHVVPAHHVRSLPSPQP